MYQVQTLPAPRKGQHLKDLHGFVSFSDFMTEEPLPLKHVLETLKLTLLVMSQLC